MSFICGGCGEKAWNGSLIPVEIRTKEYTRKYRHNGELMDTGRVVGIGWEAAQEARVCAACEPMFNLKLEELRNDLLSHLQEQPVRHTEPAGRNGVEPGQRECPDRYDNRN